jgi:hypothetical protein
LDVFIDPVSKKKKLVLEEHKKDLTEFSYVCIVKFVLTEGEKLIISTMQSFDPIILAEFGLIQNLFSIASRFIF